MFDFYCVWRGIRKSLLILAYKIINKISMIRRIQFPFQLTRSILGTFSLNSAINPYISTDSDHRLQP